MVTLAHCQFCRRVDQLRKHVLKWTITNRQLLKLDSLKDKIGGYNRLEWERKVETRTGTRLEGRVELFKITRTFSEKEGVWEKTDVFTRTEADWDWREITSVRVCTVETSAQLALCLTRQNQSENVRLNLGNQNTEALMVCSIRNVWSVRSCWIMINKIFDRFEQLWRSGWSRLQKVLEYVHVISNQWISG